MESETICLIRNQAAGNRDSFDHGTSLLKFTFSSMCYSEFMERYAGVYFNGNLRSNLLKVLA